MVLAYPDVVFEGRTLAGSANHHPFDDRLDRLRPGGAPAGPWRQWHDQGANWWQWEPAAERFARDYRRGRIPLWDSANAGGVDAHVNLTQGQYFPAYVLLLLLGNTQAARDAYLLALLAGSGACVFALARANGLHPAAGAAAAAAWMLGGTATLNVNSIVGQSAAMLPPLVLATDRFLAAPTRRRAGVLGATVALATLSSFMPVVIAGLLVVGIQILAQAAPARTRARVTALAAGAVGLGLGAAGFLLVPVMVAAQDPAFAPYRGAGLQHYDWRAWPALLSRSGADPHAGGVAVFAVGLVPALLAILAGGPRGSRQRRLAVVLAAALAFAVARLFGVPPAHWVGHLPVLRDVHFVPYGCAAVGLAVAGLAGLGVDALVRARPTRGRALALTAFAALVLATTGPAARLAGLAAAVVAVAWLRRRELVGGATAAALVLLALLVELVPPVRAARYLRAPVWTDLPPYVRFLRDEPGRFRVHSIHPLALPANVNQALGLEAVASRHAFNADRYNRLVRTYFHSEATVYPQPLALRPTRRVILDLMNVRYLIAYDPTPAELGALREWGFVPALQDGRYAILRNEQAWPRAYVAARHVVAAGTAAALDAVGSIRRGEVVLEEPPRFARDGAEEAGECQIRAYDGDYVRIEAATTRPSLVVLSDSFAAGWTATVDGAPARVLAANVAFRAVEVPAGRSTVELRYVPPGLHAGVALSAVCAALLAGLLAWPSRRVLPGAIGPRV